MEEEGEKDTDEMRPPVAEMTEKAEVLGEPTRDVPESLDMPGAVFTLSGAEIEEAATRAEREALEVEVRRLRNEQEREALEAELKALRAAEEEA